MKMIEIIVILVLILIFLLIRWSISPDIKLYTHCNWFIRAKIFLFEYKCYNCGRIAVRNVGIGKPHSENTRNHCLNKVCNWHANDPYRIYSHGSVPINNSLGWKYNKYEE